MPPQTPPDSRELDNEIRAFRDERRSVVLATTDGAGLPDASVAPCVEDPEGNIFIFVSGLARHTANLLATGCASALYLADESESDNLFARKRLTVTCAAIAISRDHPDWSKRLDELAERQGKWVETLRGLADFQLFCLIPSAATYVRGFGQAYRLTGEGLQQVSRVRPERPPPGKAGH